MKIPPPGAGRQGTVSSEAGDNVLLARLRVGGYRYPLGYVKSRHRSPDPVALAIYPDFAVIIYAGLKYAGLKKDPITPDV